MVVAAVSALAMRISVYAPTLLQTCASSLRTIGAEPVPAVAERTASLPAGVCGVIVEASHADAAAGFVLAVAVQKQLPTLCLVPKGVPLPDPLGSIRADPSCNRSLKLVRYEPSQLRRIVEQFAASCTGRGREQPTIKFTLRLTPSLDSYLAWKASANGAEKAQFLRKQLDGLLAEDKEYLARNDKLEISNDK